MGSIHPCLKFYIFYPILSFDAPASSLSCSRTSSPLPPISSYSHLFSHGSAPASLQVFPISPIDGSSSDSSSVVLLLYLLIPSHVILHYLLLLPLFELQGFIIWICFHRLIVSGKIESKPFQMFVLWYRFFPKILDFYSQSSPSAYYCADDPREGSSHSASTLKRGLL